VAVLRCSECGTEHTVPDSVIGGTLVCSCGAQLMMTPPPPGRSSESKPEPSSQGTADIPERAASGVSLVSGAGNGAPRSDVRSTSTVAQSESQPQRFTGRPPPLLPVALAVVLLVALLGIAMCGIRCVVYRSGPAAVVKRAIATDIADYERRGTRPGVRVKVVGQEVRRGARFDVAVVVVRVTDTRNGEVATRPIVLTKEGRYWSIDWQITNEVLAALFPAFGPQLDRWLSDSEPPGVLIDRAFQVLRID
jgi:hypothetical protein